jgi:hypothetical protein
MPGDVSNQQQQQAEWTLDDYNALHRDRERNDSFKCAVIIHMSVSK